MPLLDTVEWKNKQGEILHRYPEGGISPGARLIVAENQEAVVFRDGRTLDSFGPGDHELAAGEAPLLEKLVALPSGGTSPFPADVYYVNRAEINNIKWGTKQPIDLLDPVYALIVPIRASGSFSIKIRDPRSFLITTTGIWHAFTTDAVEASLRDRIVLPGLPGFMTDLMARDSISILKLASHYDGIGTSGMAELLDDFARCGLDLLGFSVESITVPQEDESVRRLKKAFAEGAVVAAGDQGGGRLERAIAAMEKAAVSGGMPGAGAVSGLQAEAAAVPAPADTVPDNALIACPHCSARNLPDSKYCSTCGKDISPTIVCPKCKTSVPANSRFCLECGKKLADISCVKCGFKLEPAMKFCPECGAQQE